MSWVMVGTAAFSAIQGKKKADAQQENQAIQNELAAQKERTSWVTGRGGQPVFGAANPYTAMLDGAAQGAMSGLAFKQQGGIGSNPETSDQALSLKSNPYASLMSPQDTNEKWHLKSRYGLTY